MIDHPAPLNTTAAFRLPAVDTVNASLAVAGARKSLTSDTLRGVRYLGTFSQDVRRFAQTDVRYVFQGISRDGKYLVTVNASIPGNGLPTRESVEASGYDVAPQPQDTDADRARYEIDVTAYCADVTLSLNGSSAAVEVTRLDQFVESLQLR